MYGLVKILRNKCPSNPEPSLEAAIVLRDVMVMMATGAYPSCENALQDIVLPRGDRQQSMYDFRSQIYKAQASMTRVDKFNSTYAAEIQQIYRVPLFPHEVDDIFAAYTECAIPDTDKRAKRPPKRNVYRKASDVPQLRYSPCAIHTPQTRK